MKIRYRIVLTCFDAKLNVPPYTDPYEEMFDEEKDAANMALVLANQECHELNGGFDGVGVFEVDECGPDCNVAVRWYEKKLEDREETDCDIETVTAYNVYPVSVEDERVYKLGVYQETRKVIRYRSFDIYPNKNQNRYSVKSLGVVMHITHTLQKALDYVDGVCLRNSEQYKTNGGRIRGKENNQGNL